MRAKVRLNTPEEEAAIQAGIDADPDSPELDDAFFANARPASEVLPPALYAELTTPRRRGPGKAPAKVMLSFRVQPDVAEALRAMGPGWQTRAGEALALFASSGPAPASIALTPHMAIGASSRAGIERQHSSPMSTKAKQPGLDARHRDMGRPWHGSSRADTLQQTSVSKVSKEVRPNAHREPGATKSDRPSQSKRDKGS